MKNMRNTHDSINKAIYAEGLKKPMYQTDIEFKKKHEEVVDLFRLRQKLDSISF